jgi:transcriptional regulator with XRE-family HTH domain
VPPVAHTIARRLIWLRKLRGITQGALAAKAGVTRSTVYDAESGQNQITVRTLLALSVALEAEASMLLGSTDPTEVMLLEDAKRRRF